jgi:hypothetical protein
MPLDASEVRVGASGSVSVAPEGTAQPAAVTTALNAAFGTELGYLTEDGVAVTDGKTVTDIGAWQSFYALRSIVTAREFTVGFTMEQWRGTNLKLAFGGATVSGSAPSWRLSPPPASTIDVKVMVIDWQDSGYLYRLVMQRVTLSDNTTFNLQRSSAAGLATAFKVLAPASGDPWYILTNDPAMQS